jgi:hypothetical protein
MLARGASPQSVESGSTMHIRDLPNISLKRLEYIVRRAFHYSRSPLCLLGPSGYWYHTSKSHDYDGTPFTDFWKLRCMPPGAKPWGYDNVYWTTTISYDSNLGPETREPDYEAMAALEGVKLRHRRDPTLCKFYLNERYAIECYELAKVGADSIAAELIALETQLMTLDKHTETLATWAASGMDMLGFCNGGHVLDFDNCRHSGLIPNAAVSSAAEQGLTLDTFRSRLRCTRCGKRNVNVSPPVFAETAA